MLAFYFVKLIENYLSKQRSICIKREIGNVLAYACQISQFFVWKTEIDDFLKAYYIFWRIRRDNCTSISITYHVYEKDQPQSFIDLDKPLSKSKIPYNTSLNRFYVPIFSFVSLAFNVGYQIEKVCMIQKQVSYYWSTFQWYQQGECCSCNSYLLCCFLAFAQ